MSWLKSLRENAEEERFLPTGSEPSVATLGMTILMELAKAVLDENVVATQTLKPHPLKRKAALPLLRRASSCEKQNRKR
jgi:hypothetical protein